MLMHVNYISSTPKHSLKKSFHNEDGAILIVVMLMLLLLTILGVTVLTSSTMDVKLAGNYRNQQQAFFVAQGALEAAPVSTALTDVITGIGLSWTGTITFNPAGNNMIFTQNAVAAPGTQNTAQVSAELVASATPPRGSGVSADMFVANYYDVNVIGMGANNSEIEINSEVYKLQAKSN